MAKQFHLPERAKYVEKARLRVLFSVTCVRFRCTLFCRGYYDPLAMMGVKRFRGLPDF